MEIKDKIAEIVCNEICPDKKKCIEPMCIPFQSLLEVVEDKIPEAVREAMYIPGGGLREMGATQGQLAIDQSKTIVKYLTGGE